MFDGSCFVVLIIAIHDYVANGSFLPRFVEFVIGKSFGFMITPALVRPNAAKRPKAVRSPFDSY